MQVQVKLFALAKDLAGCGDVELELETGATVADVRSALGSAYPDLQSLMSHLLIAVDAQYVEDDREVTASSEIACIPPVSGGSKTIDTPRWLP